MLSSSRMDLSDDVLERANARLGSTVCGRYRLDRLLGIGGMGAVYAAVTPGATQVAVKSLHAELSRMPTILARFFREAYVGNTIPHPGVARVFEHGTDDEGCAFLVMDLLDGETLEALWQRSGERLAVGHVLAVTERLLEVLDVAHAHGVIHRDVKPDNVFLTTSGELKVLDFGIARLRDGTVRTATGEMLGTPAFMSPEQAAGNAYHVDARSDVWAVGALMFTMITGQHVHLARTAQLQLIYTATQQARSIAGVEPSVPKDIVAIVDRALAFERDARWPSAGAMLAAVHAAGGVGEAVQGSRQAVPLALPAAPTVALGMSLPSKPTPRGGT
jgi:serine/threonine protein kinase